MQPILNKNLHFHIKVRGKHHPINIGLVLVVILASAITWFLTEYAVYALDKISSDYSLTNEIRPRVQAQTKSHPFLLFDSSDIPTLKAKVAKSGSLSQDSYNRLRTTVVEVCNANGDMLSGDWKYHILESSLKYAISGNTQAGDNVITIMNKVMDCIKPASLQPACKDFATCQNRLHNEMDYGYAMAVGYDIVYTRMSATKRSQVLAWLEGMAHWYWTNLDNGRRDSVHNFWSGAWGSLFMIANAIKYDTSDSFIKNDIYNRALQRIKENYNWLYSAKGGAYMNEGHGYGLYGAAQLITSGYAYYRDTGNDIIAPTGLKDNPFFWGYAHAADGGMPNYAENTRKPVDPPHYTDRMYEGSLVIVNYTSNPVFRWFWTFSNPSLDNYSNYHPNFFVTLFYPEDISSINPHDYGYSDSYYFIDSSGKGGTVAIRSGWDGNNGITSYFQNRYNYAEHQQYDMNSFSLIAYGDRFIDDAQKTDYFTEPLHASSETHNTIMIDNQRLSQRNEAYADHPSHLGYIKGFTSGDGGTVFRSDARYPYADLPKIAKENHISVLAIDEIDVNNNGGPIDQADRTVALVNGGNNPPYMVMVDTIKKDASSHSYEWRVHTKLSVQGAGTITNPFKISGNNSDLLITFIQPESFTGTIKSFTWPIEGKAYPLILVKQTGVTGHFFGILYPKKSGFSNQIISQTTITNGLAVKVAWAGNGNDYILEKRSGSSISSNSITSNGKLATVRTSGSNNVESFMLLEGSSLTYNNLDLAKITGSTGSVSASNSGTIASLDGENITGATIYSPNAKTLLVNRSAVNFTRNGNYIVYGSVTPPNQTCDDESHTPLNTCTKIGGMYCNSSGIIVEDCVTCNYCFGGWVCNATTKKCEAPTITGKIYYVRSVAQGNKDGSNWQNAWDIASINWAKINTDLYSQDVHVYFKKGDTFGQMEVLGYGAYVPTYDNNGPYRLFLTVDPADTGAKPKFLIKGSEYNVISWRNAGNITIDNLNIRSEQTDLRATLVAAGGTSEWCRKIDECKLADRNVKVSVCAYPTIGLNEKGNIHITNSDFYGGMGHSCLAFSSPGSGIILEGNTFEHCANGVYLVDECGGSKPTSNGASYCYIANNRFIDIDYNRERGIDGHAIALQSTNYCIIEDNYIEKTGGPSFGIWVQDVNSCPVCTVSFNIFRNNIVNTSWSMISGAGGGMINNQWVPHENLAKNIWYNNLMIEGATNPNDQYPRGTFRITNQQNPAGNYFFHNTIYNANSEGIDILKYADYVIVKNNIVHIKQPSVNHTISQDESMVGTHCVFDYNLYNPPNPIFRYRGQQGLSFTQWQQKNPNNDPNSIIADPGFINPGSDFTLQSTSPAVDTGGFLNFVDYSGTGNKTNQTNIKVKNPYWFHGNFGLKKANGAAVQGMLVSFYDNTNGKQDAEITNVDYNNAILTIAPAINYIYNSTSQSDPAKNTQISLRFEGDRPDIGAYEYGASTPPPAQTPPPYLKLGLHTIKVKARDSKGNTAEDTIQINVVAPGSTMTANINFPTNNSTYTQGQEINFSATVSGGAPNYTYNWSSDKKGSFSNNLMASISEADSANWPAGSHIITFTATDSQGDSDIDSVTIIINPAVVLTCGDSICSSGEICSTCPDDCGTCQTDTIPPIVNSFSLTSGSAIISWNVSDTGGSHLDRIEIWRAPDNNGSPGTWQRQDSLTQNIASQNKDSHTGTVTDNPSPGTYWYGIHVLDQAGNMSVEPNPPGPKKITITSASTGNVYYVSISSGSDSNLGTSASSPWKSISKIESSAGKGDTVYFKRGDEWHDQLDVPASNMTFGAYGIGNDPIINGADPITGWSLYSGNIYRATVSGTIYQVYYNNEFVIVAHEQDSVSPRFSGDSTPANRYQVLDDQTFSGSIVGATLVGRPAMWHWLSYKVQSHADRIITLVDDSRPTFSSDVTIDNSEPYYVANKLWMIDNPNEWAQEGTTLYLRLPNDANPSGGEEVLGARRNYGIYAKSKDNLTITGIEIKHTIVAGIGLDDCLNFSIDGVNIHHAGTPIYHPVYYWGTHSYGIRITGLNNRINEAGTIQNSIVDNVLSAGIGLDDYNSVRISGNTISNIGITGASVGAPPQIDGVGISGGSWNSLHLTINNNNVFNTGGAGIRFNTDASCSYNTVDRAMQVTDDGGGIYWGMETSSGTDVSHNTITNMGVGNLWGGNQKPGIYMDYNGKDATVAYNTITNAPKCFMIHQSQNAAIIYNTCKDIKYNCLTIAAKTWQKYPTRVWVSSHEFKNNTCIAVAGGYTGDKSGHYWFYSSIPDNNPLTDFFDSPGDLDYNTFSPDGSTYFGYQYNDSYKYFDLKGWQSATGQDANSSIQP